MKIHINTLMLSNTNVLDRFKIGRNTALRSSEMCRVIAKETSENLWHVSRHAIRWRAACLTSKHSHETISSEATRSSNARQTGSKTKLIAYVSQAHDFSFVFHEAEWNTVVGHSNRRKKARVALYTRRSWNAIHGGASCTGTRSRGKTTLKPCFPRGVRDTHFSEDVVFEHTKR
jgi:hypothetical protein